MKESAVHDKYSLVRYDGAHRCLQVYHVLLLDAGLREVKVEVVLHDLVVGVVHQVGERARRSCLHFLKLDKIGIVQCEVDIIEIST